MYETRILVTAFSVYTTGLVGPTNKNLIYYFYSHRSILYAFFI